jgi:cyclophilin family peptidyl-prolyl cis-trans isomerase/HEAT repeat protein
MQTANLRKTLCAGLLVVVSITTAAGQKIFRGSNSGQIPGQIMLGIIRAEDERRWNDGLTSLLKDKEGRVRKRAALALGRIGDERALSALSEALKSDKDLEVRQMCAFAIGEIESPAGAEALIAVVNNTSEPGEVRARAVEALGKIGAVLLSNTATSNDQTASPKAEDKTLAKIRLAILEALKFESGRRAMPDRQTILLGLTAALRVRPDGAGPVIVRFLSFSDPRIVADALNTMARLRLKDANDHVRQLLNNDDPIVRANAARVIGAAEDKGAFDALLDRALHDNDLRVHASAIRALGSLKDARAVTPLLLKGTALLKAFDNKSARKTGTGVEQNEILEIATTVGRTTQGANDQRVVAWLRELRVAFKASAPEVEIALARVSPQLYVAEDKSKLFEDAFFSTQGWKVLSSTMEGYGEFANLGLGDVKSAENRKIAEERIATASCLKWKETGGGCASIDKGVPEGLRAYAALKPTDLSQILRKQLELGYYSWGPSQPAPKGIYVIADEYKRGYTMPKDVIIRATAAELLGELPPNKENAQALAEALPIAFHDEMNDAALSILDALAKQKSAAANDAIKTALDSSDHLIRRKAVALLKANGVGDFSNRIGTVKTRNTDADYLRAIARTGRKVTATIVTSKGAFTIEFFPEEAPLTVDNFVQLARKGYFRGQTIPRVVPNFVVQTGDPRGDQNGGPGYQIRCEVNEVSYERGAVGMALSGKDTGGSQWFVTHSTQPHLDGGYTVFGRVIRGMDVVDNIARGDVILRVTISER